MPIYAFVLPVEYSAHSDVQPVPFLLLEHCVQAARIETFKVQSVAQPPEFMMSDSQNTSPIVATLLAQKGNRFDENGECIGSYNRCLVFMPRGCEPEKQYRINLQETGGKDRNGRPLYRGIPVPVEETARWIDNGNGTVSWFRVFTDWKLVESLRKVETRPKKRRDGESWNTETVLVDLGSSLATASVTVTTNTQTPEVEEVVDSSDPSRLSERQVAVRDCGTTTATFVVEKVWGECTICAHWKDWHANRLQKAYEGLWAGVDVAFDGGKESSLGVVELSTLPLWVQESLAAPYPLCQCGRERVDTPADHTTCSICRKEERQMEVLDEHLPLKKRQEFGKVATLCSAAADASMAWEGETGEMLVIALSGQGYESDHFGWKGYPWYYNTQEGIFASRFPPVAMMILSGFAGATGNGLITLASWLTSDHCANQCDNDFYARTQVHGEDVDAAPTEWSLRNVCVAVKLRESEAERLAVIADKERAAAIERQEMGVLGDMFGSPALGRSIVAFAKAAAELAGRDPALRAMQKENSAAYGRAARQEYLMQSIPGLDQTEPGQIFMRMRRASDVNEWLRGAIVWLEQGGESNESSRNTARETAVVNAAATAAPAGASFTLKSERHFLCGTCGQIARMERPEWLRHQNTGTGRITCTCGASQDVAHSQAGVKPVAAVSAVATPKLHKAPTAGSLNLAGLTALFGGNAKKR